MAPSFFGKSVPNCTVETKMSRRLADDENDVADECDFTVPSSVALETGVMSVVNNNKGTSENKKDQKMTINKLCATMGVPWVGMA
jgi:hypothetical protein